VIRGERWTKSEGEKREKIDRAAALFQGVGKTSKLVSERLKTRQEDVGGIF